MAVRWVSPYEILEAAKDNMLEGREPQSRLDWIYVVSFFSVNVNKATGLRAVSFLCKLFDIPLTEKEVEYIYVKSTI